jgi:microcystin-dependent protein
LYISTNDTLFSVIGTAFGGDGVETFLLPNLCGSVAIGAGQGTGLTSRTVGQQLGSERVTLDLTHLPNHSHAHEATFKTPAASSITGKLMGVNGSGGKANPSGNFLGKDTEVGSKLYATTTTQRVALHEGSIVLDALMAEQPDIRASRAGGDESHPNIQPVLAVNFIICTDGIYPGHSLL